MTTTPRIPTDELIYLTDGINAYRQARDDYKHASADLNLAARLKREGHVLYIPSHHEAAASAHRVAADALDLHRASLEEEGIDWQAIDKHDGHTN